MASWVDVPIPNLVGVLEPYSHDSEGGTTQHQVFPKGLALRICLLYREGTPHAGQAQDARAHRHALGVEYGRATTRWHVAAQQHSHAARREASAYGAGRIREYRRDRPLNVKLCTRANAIHAAALGMGCGGTRCRGWAHDRG